MGQIKWKPEYEFLTPVEVKTGTDLTGQKFNSLKVLYKVRAGNRNQLFWMCQCDCGNKTLALTSNLLNGQKKSCGCKHRFYGHHGTETRLYHIWCGIKARCYNKNSPKYHRYGGRGIVVCDEWKNDFSAFREWAINNGYSEELSIDRIDNDGNYEPSNCRWATVLQQSNNTCQNKRFEFEGEMMTAHEISLKTGYPLPRLRNRLRYGWTVQEALSVPYYKRPARLTKPREEVDHETN